ARRLARGLRRQPRRDGGDRDLLAGGARRARAALPVLVAERAASAERPRPQERRARLGLDLPAARARAGGAAPRAARRDPPAAGSISPVAEGQALRQLALGWSLPIAGPLRRRRAARSAPR